MTHAYLGLLGLDLLLLCSGTCVLYGLGLVRDGRGALRYSGLSFVTGWACYGVLASLALMGGAALAVWETVLLCVLVAAAGALLARRVPPVPHVSAPTGPRWLRWLGLAAGAVLVAFLVAFLVRAFVSPVDDFWDAWSFWLPKAKSIYYFGGLDTGLGGFTHFANREYPPLLPGMDATAFHFMAGVHPAALPVQAWVLAASFLGAVGALLTRRVPGGLVWPVLAMVAVMPRFAGNLLSALADQPVAFMLGLAAVCAVCWLLERDRRLAALGGVFLAASALLKNEGLLFGLALVVALALAVLFEERRSWRVVAALAAVPLLAILPWKIWLAANGEPTSSAYYSWSDVFHPGPVDRLGTTLAELPQYVLAPSRWLFTVPLVLAAAALAWRRRPALAALPVGFVALSFVAMTAIYWIGSIPIHYWIVTSAERVSVSLVVVPALVLPLLLSDALEPAQEPLTAS